GPQKAHSLIERSWTPVPNYRIEISVHPYNKITVSNKEFIWNVLFINERLKISGLDVSNSNEWNKIISPLKPKIFGTKWVAIDQVCLKPNATHSRTAANFSARRPITAATSASISSSDRTGVGR